MSSVTPTSGPRRTRNARGQGGRLRDELLDATLADLAAAGDPEDLSIRAVAKAVGVSPTAVYQHFADRDALIEAACDRAFEHFTGYFVGATASEPDPFGRLRAAGAAYLRYAADEPGLYRVLFTNPLHAGLHAPGSRVLGDGSAGSNAFDALVTIVQDCLDAGAAAFHRDGAPVDAVYLSFHVWSWLHGLVDLRITHSSMPWPPAEDMVDDIAVVLGLVPVSDEPAPASRRRSPSPSRTGRRP